MSGFVLPPNIEGLIFDCDGTLVDTMPAHIDAWEMAFKNFGISPPKDFVASRSGVPTENIIAEFNKIYSTHIDLPSFRRAKDLYVDQYLVKAQAIKPVAEIARFYYGKLPMAVASGGSFFHVKMSLKSAELFELFNAFVTADDAVAPKPAPDIFLEAARQIEIMPEKCLVFEDAQAGIVGAKKAGMSVIDVATLL
jgi:beta-phosphoglucomutase-like phosphatase (HAD superfamily)